ncbi:helix-turn-helix domain-containing protein [Actinomadura meyerae]|uniref:helix-turn-helix domain-containing protein n=1 Tax=Actinomadura meyerae TaxID=240840 RepID=UPI003CCBF291
MPDEIRDQLKPKAIDLRRQGWTYREIAGSLNISISTCSLWLRNVPAPRRPGRRGARQAPRRARAASAIGVGQRPGDRYRGLGRRPSCKGKCCRSAVA